MPDHPLTDDDLNLLMARLGALDVQLGSGADHNTLVRLLRHSMAGDRLASHMRRLRDGLTAALVASGQEHRPRGP